MSALAPRFEPTQTVRRQSDHHRAALGGWCLLSDFQNTLRDLFDGLWFERCAALYRHIDHRDRKFFPPHHGTVQGIGRRDDLRIPRPGPEALIGRGFNQATTTPKVGSKNCTDDP